MGLFSLGPQQMFFMLFARILVLFTSMPVHEYAHAYVADKLGDETALYQGRIDFNPIQHLDPFGTILLLLTGFGWARPVPINPRNFNRSVSMRAGMALTSLAGPVANILLAFILLTLHKIIDIFAASGPLAIVSGLLWLMVSINVSLAVFNLLPVPPLDGYNIFAYFIPPKWEYTISMYRQQISMVFLLLVLFTPILTIPLNWLSGILLNMLNFLTGFVDLIAGAIG